MINKSKSNWRWIQLQLGFFSFDIFVDWANWHQSPSTEFDEWCDEKWRQYKQQVAWVTTIVMTWGRSLIKCVPNSLENVWKYNKTHMSLILWLSYSPWWLIFVSASSTRGCDSRNTTQDTGIITVSLDPTVSGEIPAYSSVSEWDWQVFQCSRVPP